MDIHPGVLHRRGNRVDAWPNKLATDNNLWGGEHLGQFHQPRHGRTAWMPGVFAERIDARADRNSFHRAMKPAMIIAQCFSVLPVYGIAAPRPSSLRFRWISLRVLYSLVGISCVSFMTGYWTNNLYQNGVKLNTLSPVVFYGTSLTYMILFVILAKDWPRLAQEIHKMELTLQLQYGYCKSFARDAKVLTIVWLGAACMEHLLSISRHVIFAVHCSDSTFGWIPIHLNNFYGHIFKLVPYSTWIGLACFFTDNVATFAWNYMDVFIMIVSVMLKQRFQQFNKRIESMLNEVVPERTWRELREDFSTLTCMVAAFDARINKLVLVSFWNNLFFVCQQLYFTILSTRTLEEALYFYSSFGYLLTRFIAVCLFAAAVNDESKGPITVLYSVPSESYCSEVAGTIVTYELIMVQFNTASVNVTANQTTAEDVTVNPLCPEK